MRKVLELGGPSSEVCRHTTIHAIKPSHALCYQVLVGSVFNQLNWLKFAEISKTDKLMAASVPELLVSTIITQPSSHSSSHPHTLLDLYTPIIMHCTGTVL